MRLDQWRTERSRRAVSVVISMALLVIGCGSTSTSPTPSGSSGTSASAASATPATPTGTAATATPGSGTLTVAVTADPGSTPLGFNRPTNIVGRRVTLALFDGLFSWSYDDTSQSLHVVPDLATSWDISSDGLTYTFHLRHNVTFQDGTPFNAQAVVFNFQMLMDPTFQYYDSKAAAIAKSAAISFGLVSSYSAPDDYTFVMTLKHPFAGLFDEWAQPGMSPMWVVSPAAVQKYGVAGLPTHPVGTGPFELQTYAAGQSAVFTRNANYFKGPAGVQKMVWLVMPDASTRAAALESGQAQIAVDVGVPYVAQWKGRSDITIDATTAPNSHACWLNPKTGPMTKPQFRQAVSLAINRQQINSLVMQGTATIPNGYFSPGTLPYVQTNPPLQYDASQASSIIQSLGLKGTKITFETTTALGDPNVWVVVNQNLSAVGLTPVQRTVDLATWLSDFQNWPPPGLDMLCGLMGSDDLLQIDTLIQPFGYLPDPALDAAYNQLLNSSPTLSDYVANLEAVNSIVTKDVAALFIITTPRVFGVASSVVWKSTPTHAISYYTAHYK